MIIINFFLQGVLNSNWKPKSFVPELFPNSVIIFKLSENIRKDTKIDISITLKIIPRIKQFFASLLS